MTLNVGWFTTANGPGSLGMFRAAIDAISTRTLDANIQFVFVNRTRGQSPATDRFFDLAHANHIPVVALSSRDFRRAHGDAPWQDLRHRFDAAALERLRDYAPDIGMQAGYMLYAPLLCERFLMLNQHPALPGGTVGRWQDAVSEARLEPAVKHRRDGALQTTCANVWAGVQHMGGIMMGEVAMNLAETQIKPPRNHFARQAGCSMPVIAT